MAHSTFELSIAARKHIGRCVIYHNIRIELKVLKRCAVKCGAGYLRDSEIRVGSIWVSHQTAVIVPGIGAPTMSPTFRV